MIKRYTRKRMGNNWSELNRFTNWVKVEVAVLMAKVKTGELNVEVPDNLVNSIKINVKEINRIEREETKHDVIAFLMHTSKQLPAELRPYWHDRMTSYDTQDPGLILQLVASIDLFQEKIVNLMETIKKRAMEYKYTPQIGRTHRIHAEPIAFGVKMANWYDELKRHQTRLKQLRKMLSVIKISGGVGMYTLSPEIERIIGDLLGLKPIVATQIISRDIIAEYVSIVALIGGTIGKISNELCNLQRTEILEVQQYFDVKNQRGSSAYPHKRNPIGPENLVAHSRTLHGYVITAMENQDSRHERDLSNSGSERVILPDSSILLDYMLARLTSVIEKMFVYPDRMLENIGITKGLVFSQSVQSLVANKSGLPREDAYKLVRDIAQGCWESRADFLQELLGCNEICQHVTDKELAACFDLEKQINHEHVDHIFNQVFGKED